MSESAVPSGWRLYSLAHSTRYDSGRIALTAPAFHDTLKHRIIYYLRIFIIYSMLLWFALSVFYGCMYDMSSHAHRKHLKIIDMDHSKVSNDLVGIMLEKNEQERDRSVSPWVPQWKMFAHRRLHSLDECKEHVRKHEWGAIVINKGLQTRLQRALQQNIGYDSQKALTVLVSTGRNPIPVSRYFQPALDAMAQYASHQYAQRQLTTLTQQPFANNRNISIDNVDPAALITPIWYTTIDVSPYSFGIAPIAPLFAVFVSLACTLATQILIKLSSVELYDVVNHHQLAVALHLLMFIWSSILGLYSTLAFLAFRGPSYSSQHLGLPITGARFFAIFITFDAAILASSQWIFFWITILPPDLVPLSLISLMVPSSASSTVSLDLTPNGLRWIAAIPAHNSTMLFRTITSGAYPKVALNVGILVAEISFMFLVNLVIIMVRQDWLISGFVDAAGWYRSSIFYKQPPKYVARSDGLSRTATMSTDVSLSTALEEGPDINEMPSRHTINIMDDSETPEGMQFTLYGL
ncbi:hypothetical protein GGF40_001720 [Coemansia sp. RSA 1286]|nr:hypothetical protein GGF40_001720 [Coemansia sp. RSA 1286]